MYLPRLISQPALAGGVIFIGESTEIADDEAGHIWLLVQLLDGTRTVEQVAAAMQESDPTVIEDDVLVAIAVLAEAGLLENADD
jgi:hypothetical protein